MAGTQRNGHVQSGGPGAKGGKMRRDYYGAADWRRLAINRSMGWQEGGGGGGVGDLVVTVQDLIKQFMNTKWRPKKKMRRNCGLKGDIYDGLIFRLRTRPDWANGNQLVKWHVIDDGVVFLLGRRDALGAHR